MGINLKILAERQVDQTLYYNHESHLELRECIHDHTEDFRMVYDKEDFLKLSDHWIAARKKYDELGQPEPVEQNIDLSSTTLLGTRLHHERAAVEFTQGGADKDGGGDTIHVHYRNCRIHLTKRDFYRLAQLFTESLKCYSAHYHEEIDLESPSTKIRDVAKDKYIPWLEEYKAGKYPSEDPDSYWDLFLQMKDNIRPEEIQRPDGGWLKDSPRNRPAPDELDRRYLCSMYEVMKKYGYASGPLLHDYVRVHKVPGGQLELSGSHRAACLVSLGYQKIKVVVTN